MIAVIINGYSGCGKSTIVENFSKQIYTYEWSIADWARNKVLDAIDESDKSAKAAEFVDDYRRALIHLTNIGKRKGIIWQDLKRSYEDALNQNAGFFFIHCRDPKDFVEIKKAIPSVLTLLVSRTGIEPSNEQDKEVVNYDYDFNTVIPDFRGTYERWLHNLYIKLMEKEEPKSGH